MKNKVYISTIKEFLNDVYLCIFDGKCDVDELMKHVTKAMDFFKTYCCSIEEPSDKANTGKTFMPVSFNGGDLMNAGDLVKTSTVNKIISTINLSVVEYQKRNTSKDLLRNCEEYVSSMKRVSSLPYNFKRLDNLTHVMKEMINYDISHANSFNWAATSFIFHIIYIDVTSVIHRYHKMTSHIQTPCKDDSVSSLSCLFQSKRQFIDMFLTEVLPKVLSFNLNLEGGNVKFSNTVISEEIYQPILEVLSLYKSKTLEPRHMKDFLINNSHSLIHALSNPILGGVSISKSLPAPSVMPTLPKSGLNPGDIQALQPLVQQLVGTPNPPTYVSQKSKVEMPAHMPDDKDYKKIVLMKFFSLIEKCISAYRDQKAPASSVVVNLFDGIKTLTVKDGKVLVKSP